MENVDSINSAIYGPDGEELTFKFSPKQEVSLTVALKSVGLDMSAKMVGKLFIEKGIYEIHERKSTKTGQNKKFRKISDKYLEYGINRIGRNGQTHPYFYKSTFQNLCKKVDLYTQIRNSQTSHRSSG
jgi:hypothetical protein